MFNSVLFGLRSQNDGCFQIGHQCGSQFLCGDETRMFIQNRHDFGDPAVALLDTVELEVDGAVFGGDGHAERGLHGIIRFGEDPGCFSECDVSDGFDGQRFPAPKEIMPLDLQLADMRLGFGAMFDHSAVHWMPHNS